MARTLADKILEPENLVESNGTWTIGEKCWAAKGWQNGHVYATISLIRYDQSVHLSRYFVKTPILGFWTSFIHEKLPAGAEILGSDGYPIADSWD